MKLDNYFQINKEIIRVMKSCDRDAYFELFNELKLVSRRNVPSSVVYCNLLTSKIYVWSIFRPRDYYRYLAEYIASDIKKCANYEHYNYSAHGTVNLCEDIVMAVEKTTPDKDVFKTFIQDINEKVLFLTLTTIKYLSDDEVKEIVTRYSSGTGIVDKRLLVLMDVNGDSITRCYCGSEGLITARVSIMGKL